MDRWATFDRYGTLIDWNAGIRTALARIWPDDDPEALLASRRAPASIQGLIGLPAASRRAGAEA